MSKKGNTKTKEEQSSYELRDVVLAKVRGFPPWPGMIVDPDNVPPRVAKERPNGKKATWYAVRFFPTGDFAWVVPKDISKLKEHEIESYINEPHKRSGELLNGYKVALNPSKWEAEKEAERADVEEAEADAQVDELDDEDASGDAEDGSAGKKTAAKSRKRKREPDAGTGKKAVAAKKGTKKSSTEPAKKRTANGKGKKDGIRSKAMVESEDEGGDGDEDDEAGPSKHASPPAKKAKRDEEDGDEAISKDPEAQKVREWRHRLQKAFLNKQSPKGEDMPGMDELFTIVEKYEHMTVGHLQFSKIGKVMRHIQSQGEDKIPRDSEFKFRERAKVLVEKWHTILNSSKTNGTVSASAADKSHGGDEDAKGEDDTTGMDVDAKGEPDLAAEDKENVPAEGADFNMSALEGDISALGDASMTESAI